MKAIVCAACLLLVLSGYPKWQDLVLKLAGTARQQLPQQIAELLPNTNKQLSGYQRLTAPGLEKQITSQLNETLRGLTESESWQQARVGLKHVRFVPTNGGANTKTGDNLPITARQNEEDEEVVPTTGYYVATINYDLLSPLNLESGTALLAAACSCGVARVRLSDGYGVVKTFNCPMLKN